MARDSQSHRLELAHNLNGGLLFQKTLSRVHSVVSLHAISQLAKLRSYALIQNLLDQQATVYSYVDDLRYMAALCFLCAPMVFSFAALSPNRERRRHTDAGRPFAMAREQQDGNEQGQNGHQEKTQGAAENRAARTNLKNNPRRG